jgi:excisionase family DNA binding protein
MIYVPSNLDTSTQGGKMQGGLLSVEAAAEYLCMSESWLYQSGVPFIKLGRARRYRRDDLDRFAEQRLSHGREKGSV